MSLIEVYFDSQTLYLFKQAMGAQESEQQDVAAALKSPPGTSMDPSTLESFMGAIMRLSEHMAARIAADST
jgi:hypothetical protein